jgi:hypothetical protein
LTFFPISFFSTINFSGGKKKKPFQSPMQPRKKKKLKICTSSLEKQEGVLGVIKHMPDN